MFRQHPVCQLLLCCSLEAQFLPLALFAQVRGETATQTANISFCFEFMRWNIAGDESLVSRYNHCNFQLKSPVYKPEGSTLSEERHWEYGHIISFFPPLSAFVVHCELVPLGQTVNKRFYYNVQNLLGCDSEHSEEII